MNRHPHAFRLLLGAIGQFAPGTARLLPVPFFRHDAGDAGAAALAMILNFYGRRVTVRRMAGEVAGEGWKSEVVPQALAEAAQGHGFNSGVVRSDLCRLAEWLDIGIPPLVFPDGIVPNGGEPVAVVTGISPSHDAVRIHYGATPNQWMHARAFLDLCGGETVTTVLVSEKIRPACAKVHVRSTSSWNEVPSFFPALHAVPSLAA